MAALRLLLAISVVLGVLESSVWRETLWGAHHYAFFSPWLLALAVPPTLLALLPQASCFPPGEPYTRPHAFPGWLPWAVALLAGSLFWCFRLRHLFWGDALPLSILIPQGQAFHRDEPLSLFLHQLLYRLGHGHWSGSNAVALGNTLAGAILAGWATHWLGRLTRDPLLAALAVLVVLFQGYAPLFFGYVENYTWLALMLFLFFTTGMDHLQGRGPLWIPLLSAFVAFGFHVLGGIVVVPLIVLLVASARDGERRRPFFATIMVGLALTTTAAWLLAARFGADSPFARFPALIHGVLSDRGTISPSFLLSPEHVRDVWSEFVLLGPLSAPFLLLLLVFLPGWRAARLAPVRLGLIGSVVYLLPIFLTGEGNLGPARNWDLFAAAGVVFTLTGVVTILTLVERGQARALLLGLGAVSLFHTLPWIALNADPNRAAARVLALPLDRGRNALILGTHELNAGNLQMAERWFRRAIAADSTNANSQSGLGVVLARSGRYTQALAPMVAAVRLRPNVPQYRKDLAALHSTLGDCRRATLEWEVARSLQPGDVEAWRGLVDARLCSGEWALALAAAEEGVRRFPESQDLSALLASSLERRVASLAAAGRYEEAQSALDLLASKFPRDPRVPLLQRALVGPLDPMVPDRGMK